MSRSTDDAFRDLSGSVLSLVALADRALTHPDDASSGWGFFTAVRQLMRRVFREADSARLPRPSALMGVLEGLVTDEARVVTRRAYRPGKPRVTPSPIHPGELADAVLDVPPAEIDEFLNVVVARYLRQLRHGWLGAASAAWALRGLAPVTDADLGEIFFRTAMARFLRPELDPIDRKRFAPVLPDHAGAALYKVDFEAISALDTFPGIHVAPTCSLFRQDGERLTPLAIHVNGVLLTPGSGPAWELARYFVLQGAALSLVIGIHATVHFPMDAVNAVTKSVLPARHPVRRLLEPHLYMQLPLNYAVLYIGRSVAHNDQREIYTPFPGTKDGFFRLTRAFHRGIEGNSAYPRYRFPLRPLSIPGPYGAFLAGYWKVIRRFVARVVRCVPPGDLALVRWADEIARHVPGFPDGRTIRRRARLADALTTFICNVSVVHSADHHSYAQIPVNVMPLRLRMPPPSAPGGAPLERRRLVQWEDLFRHLMARDMYFKTTPVRTLMDAEYRFADPELGAAVADFKAALALHDERLRVKRFIPLEAIASSIQF